MGEVINLNDATPAAPSGHLNILWQKGSQNGIDPDSGFPIFPTSAHVPVLVGDTGQGGSEGLVPAPASGDAAAGKFLKADGLWAVIPHGITLETNGVANGLQTLLNLSASGAVVLSDDGSGTVTIAVPRTNLLQGANVQIVDDGGGAFTISATQPTIQGGQHVQVDASGSLYTISAVQSTVQAGANIQVSSDGAGNYVVAASGLSVRRAVVGFMVSGAASGTNVGPMFAASHDESISRCVVTVKASDATVDLSFRINQWRAGVNLGGIFSADPVVSHGAAQATVLSFTAFSATPFSVQEQDVFSLDILSGSPSWQFTAQLET